MLYKLFRSYSTGLVVIIPIVALLLWFQKIWPGIELSFDQAYNTYQMPIYRYFKEILSEHQKLQRLFTLLMIIIQSFLLLRLSNRFIIVERSYFPVFYFVVMTSAFFAQQQFNPVIIAGFLLVFILEKLFSAYKVKKLSYNFFDIGLLLALGTMIYQPFILLLPWVWISITILRPFRLREWILSILGIIIPFVLYFSYHLLFKEDFHYTWHYFLHNFAMKTNLFGSFHLPDIILASFFLFAGLIAFFHLIGNMQLKKIQTRNYFLVLIWLLLFLLLTMLIFPFAGIELIFLIAIPASFLLANYFSQLKQRWWGEILHYLLLGMLIYAHVFYYQKIIM